MTITVQGGYYLGPAYSHEPGNTMMAPKGDVCEAMLSFNQFNNIFDCRSSTSDNGASQQWQQNSKPHFVKPPANKTGSIHKHMRALLQEPQQPLYENFASTYAALLLGLVTSGYDVANAKVGWSLSWDIITPSCVDLLSMFPCLRLGQRRCLKCRV